MIHIISSSSRNVKGAYLYCNSKTPEGLVVWLTGGNDGSQMPLKFSLGRMLSTGQMEPSCAVLMPSATYGHNYTTMNLEELTDLIYQALKYTKPLKSISICGWSLGADAASILVSESPEFFDRICIMSNYPKPWNSSVMKQIKVPVLALVGEKEKSASRSWQKLSEIENFEFCKIPEYGHEIGDEIWLNEKYDILGWLTGGEKWKR